MKSLFTSFAFALCAVGFTAGLHAKDPLLIEAGQAIEKHNLALALAAVQATDDERVAAMIAADSQRLDAVLSDQLHYAHSNGKQDTKASYIESLVSHRTVYESFEYGQREFRQITTGVMFMTGKAKIKVNNGGQKTEADISFLAVWRQENDHWRFLAWQSCKIPAPAVVAPAAPVAPTEVKATITTN